MKPIWQNIMQENLRPLISNEAVTHSAGTPLCRTRRSPHPLFVQQAAPIRALGALNTHMGLWRACHHPAALRALARSRHRHPEGLLDVAQLPLGLAPLPAVGAHRQDEHPAAHRGGHHQVVGLELPAGRTQPPFVRIQAAGGARLASLFYSRSVGGCCRGCAAVSHRAARTMGLAPCASAPRLVRLFSTAAAALFAPSTVRPPHHHRPQHPPNKTPTLPAGSSPEVVGNATILHHPSVQHIVLGDGLAVQLRRKPYGGGISWKSSCRNRLN